MDMLRNREREVIQTLLFTTKSLPTSDDVPTQWVIQQLVPPYNATQSTLRFM